MLKTIVCAIALASAAVGWATGASAEPRLALVIGEGAYRTGELPTAVNDAGLVAQTLQSAGFEVDFLPFVKHLTDGWGRSLPWPVGTKAWPLFLTAGGL